MEIKRNGSQPSAKGSAEYFTGTVWDTSWLIKEDSIAGRLLHTLVGYSAAPDGAQLIAYGVAVAVIVLLMRVVTQRQQTARLASAGTRTA